VALLTFGEGWHNNHHAHPTSAAHGLAWYELDVTYLHIRALELLGLASQVRRVDDRRTYCATRWTRPTEQAA
jgi:sn-1 stearoyl-lipid 9-desaturase